MAAFWVFSRHTIDAVGTLVLFDAGGTKETRGTNSAFIESTRVGGLVSDVWGLLETTSRIEDFDVRFEARKSLLAQLARRDGRRAATYLSGLPEAERLPELEALVVGQWASVEADAALAWLTSQGRDKQLSLASALGGGLSGQTSERLQSLLVSLKDDSLRVAVAAAVVREWSRSRPAEAAEVAVSMMSEDGARDILGGVVSEWARADAAGVARWLIQLPNGSVRSSALTHLATVWGGADAPAAARFAETIPAEAGYSAVLAGRWAQSNPRAAADWVLTLPIGVQQQALGALAAGWARVAPRDAVEFATGLSSGDSREVAMLSALSAWAASAPGEAALWVAYLPAGELRLRAIDGVADRWIYVDPRAAMAWQQALPAGAERDAALQASASRLVRLHPDLALEIATVISDPIVREEQASRAAAAWLACDPSSARSWIAQSSLPRALKQRLLHR